AFFTSVDDGQTWVGQSVPYNAYMLLQPSFYFTGLSCTNPASCYAVGAGGEIFATNDSGQNWRDQMSGVIGFFNDLTCVEVATCYIAASDRITYTNMGVYTNANYLVKTTNAGASWSAGPSFI